MTAQTMSETTTAKPTAKQRAGLAAAVAGGGVLLFLLLNLRAAPSPVTNLASDERLVFLPTHASFDVKKKTWRVHVHAWVYEPERKGVVRRAARAGFRETIDVPENAVARKRFQRRVDPFLYDNERGKSVIVRLGGKSYRLGVTDKDGHVRKTFELTRKEFATLPRKSGRVVFRAELDADDSRTFQGAVKPIPPGGLSVISDVDDTIKITNVTDRKEMLANTFYRPFRPVTGMAELYQKLEKQGAVFHYVSASPWQLLKPLEEFRRKHGFPAGVYHLRRMRLADLGSLDAKTNAASKQQTILALLEEFPKRKFLLFGDSGERDPEIYAEAMRKHPGQVLGIAIRNVTRQPRSDPRYQKVFRGLPAERTRVFEKPAKLKTILTR